MKKSMIAAAAITAALFTGCQSISKVEYYEPTEANAAYCTPRTDTQQGHGPVKFIEGKSGCADFSDNKTFKFNLSVLGL